MRSLVAKFLWGITILLTTFTAHTMYINQMVVFGDSSMDTGRFYEYTRYKFPISPPYFKGRFSNGPLWIEHLSKYYFPHQTSHHIENYAFAGSGITEKEVHLPMGANLTLTAQMESYFFHHSKTNPKALYIFSIGAGNYFYRPNGNEAVVGEVLQGLSHAMTELAAQGAGYILVTNLPDLGKTPLARKLNQENNLSAMSMRHNELLDIEFQRLKTAYPNTRWFMLDLNQASEEIYTYPGKLNIANTYDACYESIGIISLHTAQSELSLSERINEQMLDQNHEKNTLNECKHYMYFDMIHPTQSVQTFVANKAADLLRWNV